MKRAPHTQKFQHCRMAQNDDSSSNRLQKVKDIEPKYSTVIVFHIGNLKCGNV
jgi:hypothetical protein